MAIQSYREKLEQRRIRTEFTLKKGMEKMMRGTSKISASNSHDRYSEQTGSVSSPRPPTRVEARLKVRYGPLQDLLTGYSVNLSSGGMFLETDQILPEETSLAVEFLLPESGRIIRCQGRVAWVNRPNDLAKPQFPPGMGLQFVNLTMGDMAEIREFVRKQSISAVW